MYTDFNNVNVEIGRTYIFKNTGVSDITCTACLKMYCKYVYIYALKAHVHLHEQSPAYMVYGKKNATICRICAPRFDKKHAVLLWFASGFVRKAYCGAFCQTHRNSASAPHFHGKKRPRIAALYKTAHCGTAIKIQYTRWEKCGAHGTTFSSAAAACLLHSF